MPHLELVAFEAFSLHLGATDVTSSSQSLLRDNFLDSDVDRLCMRSAAVAVPLNGCRRQLITSPTSGLSRRDAVAARGGIAESFISTDITARRRLIPLARS